MDNRFDNSILITGIPRSGTTYLGRVLSFSQELIYLWEPFQVGLKEKNKFGIFDYWFENLEGNAKEKDVFNFLTMYSKINNRDFLKLKTRSLYIFNMRLNNILKKIQYPYKLSPYRYVLKDPIAFFSVEWLFQKIKNLKVIITIRNPVSFCESFKRLNWNIDLGEIAQQHDLVKQLSPEYTAKLLKYSANRDDVVENCILLWNIFYSRVLGYMQKYSDRWLFLKCEDIGNNQLDLFSQIFDHCGLDFNNKIASKIFHHDSERIKNASTKKICQDNYLSDNQIQKIKNETFEIAKQFNYFL